MIRTTFFAVLSLALVASGCKKNEETANQESVRTTLATPAATSAAVPTVTSASAPSKAEKSPANEPTPKSVGAKKTNEALELSILDLGQRCWLIVKVQRQQNICDRRSAHGEGRGRGKHTNKNAIQTNNR